MIIKGNVKTCFRCKQELDSSLFLPNKTTKDKLNGWCKPCTRDNTLLKKYGIDLNFYNQKLQEQGGVCKLCGTNKPEGRRNVFVVDHCHITGEVRGLLCNHCNTGIGKLKDNPDLLRKAADYLESVLK